MKNWFKILISVCAVIITISIAYNLFIFLPEQRDYNRSESKRFECKQDIANLFSEYNATASNLEQSEENEQFLFSYALNIGLIDQTGEPIERDNLIQRCIQGEL